MAVNWVACGGPPAIGQPSVYYSTDDGISWNPGTNTFPFAGFGATYTENGKWVSVGNANLGVVGLQTSPDGQDWSFVSNGFDVIGWSVAYGNGTIIAIGLSNNPTRSHLLRSTDIGQTWNETAISFSNGRGISYGNNTWIAVGAGTDTILRSTDEGVTWNPPITGDFGGGGGYYGLGVAYGDNTWIAVGYSSGANTILRSTDGGLNWNPPSTGDFGGGGGYYGVGVAYGGNTWIAVGYGPNNILRSTDGGLNWNPPDSGSFDEYGYTVSYNNGIWIAGGRGTTKMLRSTDGGLHWSPISVALIEVRGIASLSNPDPLPCFLKGTHIQTPTGYTRIEDLKSGDVILTADNRSVSIKLHSFTVIATKESAPYRIPAGTFGVPINDLHLSGNHAIQVGGSWQIPRFLAQKIPEIQQHSLGKPVTYYHIECPNYLKDNLVAEGVTAESLNTKNKVIWKRTGTGYSRTLYKNAWWRSSTRK